MNTYNIVEAVELTKIYNGKIVAVNKISFSVERGEIFGFLGPNGAGKTTTINILTTLLKPTSGRAMVSGFDVVTQPNLVRSKIGLVPQDIAVDDDLTGRENLMLQAKLYHVPGHEAKKRIDEVLELVGLSEAADRRVSTYSGGMRRRLEIAGALIHRPEVLFMDEPTLGLDVNVRNVIWDYIKLLRNEYEMTIFLTTHYMDEADKLCDRIAIIDEGKIKALDKPSNLKNMLGGDIIEISLEDKASESTFSNLDFVKKTIIRDNKVILTVREGERALPQIIGYLLQKGTKISSVQLKKPSLDEVFLSITGKSLREEKGSWEEMMRFRINIGRRRRGMR